MKRSSESLSGWNRRLAGASTNACCGSAEEHAKDAKHAKRVP